MSKNETSLVSVIVIQYKDKDKLSNCLASVKKSGYPQIEIIVVDNDPVSFPILHEEDGFFYFKNKRNLGFAEGCNVGIRGAKGKYVFILNNDVEIESDCIEKLVELSERDSSLGVLQPKMLDFYEKNKFHSGAGGGMIDIFGYPFARGRIFETVEEDKGQYDNSIDIFWAGGAAFFARKKVIEEAGLFDKDFFLYMEEIDLCWKVHLLGYKIVYVPEAKIYHIGCPNLGREDLMRMYYVHRNSMIMLLKNLSFPILLILFPVRIILELGIMLISVVSFRLKRTIAIGKAFIYIFSHIKIIWRKRKNIQKKRKVPYNAVFEKMYKNSVLLQYSILGKRHYSEMNLSASKYSQP